MVSINKEDGSRTTTFTKYYGSAFEIENNILRGCKVDFNDNRHIGQIIFDALNKDSQHIGIVNATTGKVTTFTDIKEKSVRLASWFEKEGIIPGDIISLFSPIHHDIYSIIFATCFIGATYNPCEYNVDIVSARDYIKTTQPKIIFVYEDKVDVIEEAVALENQKCKIIVLGEKMGLESFDQILYQQTNDELDSFKVISELNPNHIFSIFFSSGTTGTPKGVPHSYEQTKLIAMTPIVDEDVENDVHLHYLYPSWAIHSYFALNFIIKKTTQIFHEIFDPKKTCEIIERYKISLVSFDTSKLMHLCSDDLEAQHDLQSVKLIIPFGTKVTVKAMKSIKNRFPNAFISKRMGLSEAHHLTRFIKGCSNIHSEGIVRPNVWLAIKDMNTGKKLGSNKVGELCVKSPYVITDYYKNPAETARAFDHEGWFHTGDEAYYDENGEVVIVGRIKDFIRYRDVDIHPSYVEDLLLALPDIVEAVVIGIPHETDLERPIAFIKKIPTSKVTGDLIWSKVAPHLQYSDMLKDAIHFIDEIPRNSNGKIQKNVLKEIAQKYYE